MESGTDCLPLGIHRDHSDKSTRKHTVLMGGVRRLVETQHTGFLCVFTDKLQLCELETLRAAFFVCRDALWRSEQP